MLMKCWWFYEPFCKCCRGPRLPQIITVMSLCTTGQPKPSGGANKVNERRDSQLCMSASFQPQQASLECNVSSSENCVLGGMGRSCEWRIKLTIYFWFHFACFQSPFVPSRGQNPAHFLPQDRVQVPSGQDDVVLDSSLHSPFDANSPLLRQAVGRKHFGRGGH